MTPPQTPTKNVDMLLEAREAQWTPLTFMGPDTIKLVAPAKVNLFLDVHNKRADGYHDVTNVMHSLALHDIIYMNFKQDTNNSSCNLDITVETVVKDTSTAERANAHFPLDDIQNEPGKNLAYKAVTLLAEALKASASEKCPSGQMHIRIEKHIPVQAGLGGGSSDAAAALIGAADLWNIPNNSDTVKNVAYKLGADVAFFLDGGCSILKGAGEKCEMQLQSAKMPIVIVKPTCGVNTAMAYKAYDENPTPAPKALCEKVKDAESACDIPLYNGLEAAAKSLLPELADIKNWLANQIDKTSSDAKTQNTETDTQLKGTPALLCGSGSAVFAITESYSDALRIATDAQKRGWWGRATSLSSLKASKVS